MIDGGLLDGFEEFKQSITGVYWHFKPIKLIQGVVVEFKYADHKLTYENMYGLLFEGEAIYRDMDSLEILRVAEYRVELKHKIPTNVIYPALDKDGYTVMKIDSLPDHKLLYMWNTRSNTTPKKPLIIKGYDGYI